MVRHLPPNGSNSFDVVDGIGKNADEACLTFNYFNRQLAALFFDRWGRLRSYHPQADQKGRNNNRPHKEYDYCNTHDMLILMNQYILLMPVPVAFQHHAQLPFFRLPPLGRMISDARGAVQLLIKSSKVRQPFIQSFRCALFVQQLNAKHR